eukprot:sb/3478369/
MFSAENYVQTWCRRSSDVLQTYSRRNGLGLNRLDVLRTYYRRTTDVKKYVPTTSARIRYALQTLYRRSTDVMENALSTRTTDVKKYVSTTSARSRDELTET